MRARYKVLVAVGVLVVTSRDAGADEPLHLVSGSSVTTDGGSELRLPPGYFVDEPTWDSLDFKVRAMQDDVTRLKAENESLRASAKAGGGLSWWTLGALVVGAAGGVYAWERWAD